MASIWALRSRRPRRRTVLAEDTGALSPSLSVNNTALLSYKPNRSHDCVTHNVPCSLVRTVWHATPSGVGGNSNNSNSVFLAPLDDYSANGLSKTAIPALLRYTFSQTHPVVNRISLAQLLLDSSYFKRVWTVRI